MAKRETAQADFYVKLGGTHPQIGVDEPKLGDMVEVTAYGQVIDVGDKLRKDGETRHTVAIDAEAVWFKGQRRPDNANQASMVNGDGSLNPEATGTPGEMIPTGDSEE